MATKANKQVIIDFILSCLHKGGKRSEVLAKVVKKWQISDRTFDRLWKNSNVQHVELQDKAKDASDKAYIEASENAAKEAVMSKQERQEVLTKIARGELSMMVNVEGKPDPVQQPIFVETAERIRAIAEINKMDGSYAPIKNALTDGDGKDIDLTKLPVIFK